MSVNLASFLYLVSGVLFIMALRGLSHPTTSRQGNAYGMANTLRQTAFLRPSIKSKKVENLYFTGQLTVPGPGVPPALISGKIVAEQIIKTMTKNPKYVVDI